MKKTLITTSLIALLSTSSALAKTSGNYFGIDLNRSSSNHQYSRDNINSSNYKEFSDSSIGFGLNYKYAFNFDKIFIAPGIFFDQIKTKAQDRDSDSVSINNRYGAKLDIGYDITDEVAIYFTSGLSSTSYRVDWKSINQSKSSSNLSYFLGMGAAYNVTKNLTLNLEYNFQQLNLETPDIGGINNVKTNLGMAKIGIAYHF